MRGGGGLAGSRPMSTDVHRSPNKIWRSNSICNLRLTHSCQFFWVCPTFSVDSRAGSGLNITTQVTQRCSDPFFNIRIPCAGCASAWRACATRTRTLCTSCTPSSRTSPSPRAASRASRLRMSRPRNRESYSYHQLLTQSVCVLKWNLSFFWINNNMSNMSDLSEVYFWHFQVVLV